jgi:hypothetical protein
MAFLFQIWRITRDPKDQRWVRWIPWTWLPRRCALIPTVWRSPPFRMPGRRTRRLDLDCRALSPPLPHPPFCVISVFFFEKLRRQNPCIYLCLPIVSIECTGPGYLRKEKAVSTHDFWLSVITTFLFWFSHGECFEFLLVYTGSDPVFFVSAFWHYISKCASTYLTVW